MRILPPTRPKQSVGLTMQLARNVYGQATPDAFVFAMRGYYRDSMGKRGRNDRGIYDDAVFVVWRGANGKYEQRAFNANTDPSVTRKHVAVLQPGVWRYKPGIHGLSKPKWRRYSAFVQASGVTITRDEEGTHVGQWIGLNIHKGSRLSTSSLGCQTIWPGQWSEFYELVCEVTLRRPFDYVLTIG